MGEKKSEWQILGGETGRGSVLLVREKNLLKGVKKAWRHSLGKISAFEC